jgi:nucleoside-diphosphate-sugar epimerase
LFAKPIQNVSPATVVVDHMDQIRPDVMASRSWNIQNVAALPSATWTALFLAICTYFYFLDQRLRNPSPKTRASSPLPPLEELKRTEYESIDMLKAVPKASGDNYIVIGGSGIVGSALVRLLLLRKDTNIRIVDISPPPPDLVQGGGVEYVRTDISRADHVNEAIKRPFRNGRSVDVVHNTSAMIRFWERASYSYHVTEKVNVHGPQNIVDALLSIEVDKGDSEPLLLVQTSSSIVLAASPKYMRLGFCPRLTEYRDDAKPHPPHVLVKHHYAVTKRHGEAIVRAADGKDGKLRTGIIRPGMYVSLLFGHDRQSESCELHANCSFPLFCFQQVLSDLATNMFLRGSTTRAMPQWAMNGRTALFAAGTSPPRTYATRMPSATNPTKSVATPF